VARRRTRSRQMAVGLLVSAVAIAWLAHKVDFGELRTAFSRLALWWIPLLATVYLSGFVLRGLRWRLMLRPIKTIGLSTSIAVILVGYMANNLLPARLGEVVRAFTLSRAERVSAITSVASIGIERIFDGLALLLIFALASAFGQVSADREPLVASVGIGATVVFIGALATLFAARVQPGWIRAAAGSVSRLVPARLRPRVGDLTERVLDATCFLVLDRRLPAFLALSLGVWLLEGSMYLLALPAFGLPMSPALAYFTLAFANFGILIPSAPGYVGVYQTCVVLAFGAFGLPPDLALVYAITLHAVQFIPVTLLGLLAAWRLPRPGGGSPLEVQSLAAGPDPGGG
jgi:glycosyltransferase 2 family protein